MSNTRHELTITAAASRQSERRQLAVTRVRYSPWHLAASASVAMALLIGAVMMGAWLGWQWGVPALLMALPAAAIVGGWTWEAWRVERERLAAERADLCPPAATAADDDEHVSTADPGEDGHLLTGYYLDGHLVSPARQLSPAREGLRNDCILFVMAGLRRGGWSRSRLAEGPERAIAPGAWDRASKELQHLGMFRPGAAGLEPTKSAADTLRLLEYAR